MTRLAAVLVAGERAEALVAVISLHDPDYPTGAFPESLRTQCDCTPRTCDRAVPERTVAVP